jgi:hypothetical protein
MKLFGQVLVVCVVVFSILGKKRHFILGDKVLVVLEVVIELL